MKGISSFLF